MSEYAALVAIDWADKQHAVCLLDPSTGEREPAIVKQTPEALQAWALGLPTLHRSAHRRLSRAVTWALDLRALAV